MSNDLRRVAIVGSTRIPFARSNGAYSALGNLDMLTAALVRWSTNSGSRAKRSAKSPPAR